MIDLYIKTGCPYCAVVLHKVEELGIDVNLKNTQDPQVVSDLIEKGGKQQVPYLVDKDGGVSLYESADIVEYLDRKYSKKD